MLLKAVTELPEVRDCSSNRELIPESPASLLVGNHSFPDHTLFPDSARAGMDRPVSRGRPPSFPEDRMSFHLPCFEKFFRKIGHCPCIVSFAAKHIEIDGVGLIGKMGRDQGGLNELSHGESRHPFVLAEMNHLSFPEALHFNEVAEFNHKSSNGFCVPNNLRITMIKVNGSKNPPGWLFPGFASWAVLLHSDMTLLYVFFEIESSSFYRVTPQSEEGWGDKTTKRDKSLSFNKPKSCQKHYLLILLYLFRRRQKGTGTVYSDILCSFPPGDPNILRFVS